MGEASKPFYMRPPWHILFDLARLTKVHPWDVNIKMLLASFLDEMVKGGYIDFAASGTVLLSSSIVLKLQSERILELEEPPKVQPPVQVEYVPPALTLPFRFEYTSTTIDQLLTSLEEVLKSETIQRPPRLTMFEPPPVDFLKEYDKFFIEVESKIVDLHSSLIDLGMNAQGLVSFTSLVKGKAKIEAVRIFILLLFLAARAIIELHQDEEFGEIYIALKAESESSEYKQSAI